MKILRFKTCFIKDSKQGNEILEAFQRNHPECFDFGVSITNAEPVGYKFVAKTHRLAYGMKVTFLT